MNARASALAAIALLAAACASKEERKDPAPLPVITSFTAADDALTTGGETTLVAVFSDGTGAVDHAVGAVTSGVAAPTGALTADTTFTLTVTNADGVTATATATVSVHPAAVITSFAPAKSPVTIGDATTLTASFSGGTGVVSPAIGGVTAGVPVGTGTVDGTTTWTLTVTNAAGDAVTADATVVAVPPPAIAGFTSATPSVAMGTAATLRATFSAGTGLVDGGVGAVTSGVDATTPLLDVETTFTLTVTNPAGATATAQVTVGVHACDDAVRNGDEVGVDCGGSCPTCPADCAAVLAADASAPSGVYGIDPDGDGGDGAIRAWCDMTTDGGGFTLCGVLGDAAKGDGFGYLASTWGTGTTPFFDGTTVLSRGNFCGALPVSSLVAAHWSSATTERFRTAPIATGGQNPFASPTGAFRYADGGNVIGLISKSAMSRGVYAWGGCTDDDNGFRHGTSLCFADGTSWQMIVGNLNDYMYRGEGEWMCGPNGWCGGPDGGASILLFAR